MKKLDVGNKPCDTDAIHAIRRMNTMLKKSIVLLTVLLVSAGMLFAQSFSNSDKWSLFDDKGDNGSSKISRKSEIVNIDGNDVLSVTLTGTVTTKFQYGYAGATADGDPAVIEALKSASAITFKTKGDGKTYRVRVETSNVTDYDYFGFVFTAPKGKAVEVTVPYSKLKQEGWGAPKKFDAANAKKVSFQTVGQPIESFEFTIIDLKPVK